MPITVPTFSRSGTFGSSFFFACAEKLQDASRTSTAAWRDSMHGDSRAQGTGCMGQVGNVVRKEHESLYR